MPNTRKPKRVTGLQLVSSRQPNTPDTSQMTLWVEKLVERDGVDMGVLSDGTAFLSGRGLARLCGVSVSVIAELLADWNHAAKKPRIRKIKEILAGH
jgi:hypothetical protein